MASRPIPCPDTYKTQLLAGCKQVRGLRLAAGAVREAWRRGRQRALCSQPSSC